MTFPTTGETYLTDLADGVLTVTLNRPDQLNALSQLMQRELAILWGAVRQETSVRCVVVTAAGRAFSAGADVGELAGDDAPPMGGDTRNRFCPAETVDVPVLVAVNGLCIGGGLRFLADADIAIASDLAWFSDPHVTVGQLGTPIALALAAKSASSTVVQLFLSGAGFRMPAAQALAGGLISEVVPADSLPDRAHQIASMIAAQSPTAVRTTVAALRHRTHRALQAEMEQAWAAVAAQANHPDAKEGPRALAERRRAQWAEPEESSA